MFDGEKFETVIEIEKCDPSSIAESIDQWIVEVGIEKHKVFMFTYDGAAVMTGKYNGVAQKLREDYGYTRLIDYHCVCHRESLAIKDSYKV